LCGVIFDADQNRVRLKALEERSSQPDFWNDQEAAQAVLRDRKRATDMIDADAKLTSLTGDIDTYIELAAAETNSAQKEELLKDLSRELQNLDSFTGQLETDTLLSGETDHLNAIMTIKPGAGGTESQDWASILLRMYLRWAQRFQRRRPRRNARRRSGHQERHHPVQRRKCLRSPCR
jgi:peptide chain release factor 2